jgi:hypothetical protein
MHLITPLMTGVRGAKNGTVFCYERGTNTPAPVYADASGKVRRYGAIRLDALGSVALYVDRLVDVTVHDAYAAVVREWTDGRADGAVVVESDAFTGVDYETGVSAVGERTTLAEALGRALGSFGAVDWNVLVDSESLPVYVAVGDATGPLFNARAFGARGDDTVDDVGPIQVAIDAAQAAGGGVVYLPPGTYRISGTLALYGSVSLTGDNAASAKIVVTGDVPGIYTFGGDDPAALAQAHTVSCLSFKHEVTGSAYSDKPIIEMVSGSLVVSDCNFDGEFNVGNLMHIDALQAARVSGCTFLVMAPTTSAINTLNTLVPGGGVQRANIDNCVFTPLSTRDANTPLVGISRLHMEGCHFPLGSIPSGDVECIRLAGNVHGWVDGCSVTSMSMSSGTATLLFASALFDSYERIFEDCSLLDPSTPFRLYTLVDNGGDGYYSRLKTVEARHSPVTNDLVATNSGLNHPILPDVSQYGVFTVSNSVPGGVGAPESSVVIGAADTSTYSNNMNLGRTIDILYHCLVQDGFNLSENRFRNSVVPRWNFRANSVFGIRLMSARMPATAPVAGTISRLHTLGVAGGPASVNLQEREAYLLF